MGFAYLLQIRIIFIQFMEHEYPYLGEFHFPSLSFLHKNSEKPILNRFERFEIVIPGVIINIKYSKYLEYIKIRQCTTSHLING
jgi:hypothetical protein